MGLFCGAKNLSQNIFVVKNVTKIIQGFIKLRMGDRVGVHLLFSIGTAQELDLV